MAFPSSVGPSVSTGRSRRGLVLALLALLLAGAVIVLVMGRSAQEGSELVMPAPEASPLTVEVPRQDFADEKPTDFPGNIPIEEGARLQKSYALDYSGEKQLTVTFVSKETVQRNLALYKDFLKKDVWVVMSEYENEALSSLYAMKENTAVNITLSGGGAAGSHVSISVLKK